MLLLSLIGGGLYAVVVVAPFYVDHLDMKEAVAAAFNLAGRNANDGLLRSEIRERTKHMGTHLERDSWNVERMVPGLGLTDEQITIERSSITGNVRIEVNYDREVEFKPFQYVRTFHFRAVQEGLPPQ
ncbi:hypothetical protein P2318_15510 [Myxococcaceae bacterium GXIMD 01537]